MITGLAGTTIFSQDHRLLVPFYRDLVGLQVQEEGPGETIFGPAGGAVLLVATHSAVQGHAKEPERQIPSLLSDDVRGDYARLVANGVEFLGEPAHDGPATFVTFRDPEGNLVNILQFD